MYILNFLPPAATSSSAFCASVLFHASNVPYRNLLVAWAGRAAARSHCPAALLKATHGEQNSSVSYFQMALCVAVFTPHFCHLMH